MFAFYVSCNGTNANMISIGVILILFLGSCFGQGAPKRLQIASMTAKIGNDGTGKIENKHTWRMLNISMNHSKTDLTDLMKYLFIYCR